MTDSDNIPPTYAAIITIRHPQAESAATITVVLRPTDEVTVEGQTRLVQDCTLAELRAYAEAWETAVWQTYEAITLGQLAEDEQVEFDLTLVDETGAYVPADWRNYALILPPTPVEETAVTESETEELSAATPPTAPETKPESPIDPAPAPLPSQPAPTDTPPEVIVSPSEPIYEEKEADPDDDALTVPVLGPQPGRIAGQKRPLHDLTWAAVDVFIEEPALRAAQAHALSSPTREVAGVLVGPRPEKQPDGRYRVHISDTIIAKHTVMQGASVTYTPESWRYMNDQLALRYPDETSIMVGWYHTHPGFGIFLSGMDLFIHQNFFTQIWHVALVLDPRARSAGFFGWDRQRTRVSRLDFQWPNWAEIW